jgi:hypothetical protein
LRRLLRCLSQQEVDAMHCAFCGRPIKAKSAWKGANEQFYCSEFCADSEGTEMAPAPAHHRGGAPTLLDRHLSRPYERLEKLLPYKRQLSGRAAAGVHREPA